MRLLKDRQGAELTEIALVLALVVVAAIIALRLLGTNIRDLLSQIAGVIGGG